MNPGTNMSNRATVNPRAGLSVLIIGATVVMLTQSAARSGGRADSRGWESDELAVIEKRLDTIESQVRENNQRADARFEVLEKGFRDLARAMGGSGWSSVESNLRQLKKSIGEQHDAVKRAESEIAKLRRNVDDLERRLHRLESRS